MKLDTKYQWDFEQNTLQLPDTYVIDWTGAEFTEEFLRAECT